MGTFGSPFLLTRMVSNMRRCNQCGETKPLDEFGNNKFNPEGKSYMCKPCRRVYDRRRYKDDPTEGRGRNARHKARKTTMVRELVWDILTVTPCVDCDLLDPVVMEFDHRPDETKLYNIGAMIGNTYSIETVQAEIDKCDVVCANCHRRRTNGRGGWWRDTMVSST